MKKDTWQQIMDQLFCQFDFFFVHHKYITNQAFDQFQTVTYYAKDKNEWKGKKIVSKLQKLLKKWKYYVPLSIDLEHNALPLSICLSVQNFVNFFLTLSETSPGFYVSALRVFWKHCGKRRNCSFSHSVFYLFGELSANSFSLEESKSCCLRKG